MALVCDIESNTTTQDLTKDVAQDTTKEPVAEQEASSAAKTQEDIDLEDGEIEDDDEEPTAPEELVTAAEPAEPPKSELPSAGLALPFAEKSKSPVSESEKPGGRERVRDRSERGERRKHDEKGKKHMTEAEKSILHLRKREEMQRKKWEKLNRMKDLEPEPDDFAKNIEKTLATILNKKEKEAAAVSGGEDKDKEIIKDEERRSKKRRKHEKDRKDKHRRLDTPPNFPFDDQEMINVRGGSPERRFMDDKVQGSPALQSEESIDSEYASDRSKTDDRGRRKREFRKCNRKNRDREHRGRNKKRDRDRTEKKNNEQEQLKDTPSICVFYLQGNCNKTDCPFSHDAVQPMKFELCKFYLRDCCAKGDKCSYMHSEFPCKFYHTGLPCNEGENCKFTHGKTLSERLKQTLYKHIETAPRDLLGGFPRMSREEVLNFLNQTQTKLQEQHEGNVPQEENVGESKGGIPSLFDISVPIPPELLQGNDGGKSEKGNNRQHYNRPSRWHAKNDQDANANSGNEATNFPLKPFNYGQDHDMRINSNGDVDMRTLPPMATPPILNIGNAATENNDVNLTSNFDFHQQASKQDVDIRTQPLLPLADVDIRQLPGVFGSIPIGGGASANFLEEESKKPVALPARPAENVQADLPSHLAKTQRDLFLRIQAQQKEQVAVEEKKNDYNVADNINWYSDDDDDDDNRLTIKVDNEEVPKEKEEHMESTTTVMEDFSSFMSPPTIKPLEVVEKLGDLSKIDISAEVTKLLTSMSQGRNQFLSPPTNAVVEKNITAPPESGSSPPATTKTQSSSDPRMRQDPRVAGDKSDTARSDPRLLPPSSKPRSRQSSSDQQKSDKVSIYEQGSIDRNASNEPDIDIRGMRADVDLRNMQLFKGMQNYTPCSEIDANINSHPPITWQLVDVDIPRPDYTGLKLSVSDAEKTGDPRLRKIFRLSTEERDTPLSPKASPKSSSSARVDPRLRKMEENKPETSGSGGPMSFAQQLTMLQSSAFYQSLTSNQKLLLNQEVNQRNDSNAHDPVLNSLLSNLNIIPNTTPTSNVNVGVAQSILSSISKLNPMVGSGQQAQPNLPMNPAMLGQMAQRINQPGLLGAAPGIPNLPPDFPINFDPRNGGLLGNAPPITPYGGFPPPHENQGNFNNYNDDYYPPEGGNVGGNFQSNRDNRGFNNRDRRRGRNFNNNRGGNRNFRNNRNNRINRHHSPP